MKSETYNRVVEISCPSCGIKRNAELRRRGVSRLCRSCGNPRISSEWLTTHGESKTPLYKVWNAMKQRCLNTEDVNYPRYGGRDITICLEWMEFVPFRDWAISHGYEKGLYLDREDNDGNYSPNNCRWVISGVSAVNRPQTKMKPAQAAVIRELSLRGLPTKLIAALYGINQRRVSEIRCGYKFGWVTPTMVEGW